MAMDEPSRYISRHDIDEHIEQITQWYGEMDGISMKIYESKLPDHKKNDFRIMLQRLLLIKVYMKNIAELQRPRFIRNDFSLAQAKALYTYLKKIVDDYGFSTQFKGGEKSV